MSIIRDGALTVTKMGEGNYESRQRRVSYYNNQKLVIYNDRNGKLCLDNIFAPGAIGFICLCSISAFHGHCMGNVWQPCDSRAGCV